MKTRETILVTGAAGWLGRLVSLHLQNAGYRVLGMDRTAITHKFNDTWIGDLGSFHSPPSDLCIKLKYVRTVIHCAGYAHRSIESPAEVSKLERINVDGTKVLVEACKKFGVQRIVYVSTIAGYDWGTINGGPCDEESRLHYTTAYARTKLDGERLVRESSLDWRAVRLATVFGEGDHANFSKLAKALKARRFIVPGSGDARKSVVPAALAAEILARLAIEDFPKHRLINGALSDSPTLRNICDSFSTTCGFKIAPSIPLAVMRSGALFGGVISRIWPSFPLTNVILSKLVTATVVDNRRLRETFPDLHMPTFVEALRSAVEYYKSV